VVPPQDDASTLVIEIAQISEEGFALDTEVHPVSLHVPQEEDTVVTEPVHVQGLLTSMAGQIYFRGCICGVVAVPCGRCLEIVHTDFVAETQVVFLPPTSIRPYDEEGRLSAAGGELDLYMHDGVTLDLRPLVREQVVLSFPVQPLCRDDCAGLCQVCGTNRNAEGCTCQASGDDSRFAVLKQLRLPGAS
jgi:uncharacterized protein